MSKSVGIIYWFCFPLTSTVSGSTTYYVPSNARIVVLNYWEVISMQLSPINNHYNGIVNKGDQYYFQSSTEGNIKETAQTSTVQGIEYPWGENMLVCQVHKVDLVKEMIAKGSQVISLRTPSNGGTCQWKDCKLPAVFESV